MSVVVVVVVVVVVPLGARARKKRKHEGEEKKADEGGARGRHGRSNACVREVVVALLQSG